MAQSVEVNWANVLTREANGLIASALLQSVAHRSHAPGSEPWTTVESRDLREVASRSGVPDASDDDVFDVGPLHDIGAGLARVALRDGGKARTASAPPESTGNGALDEAIGQLPDRGLYESKETFHVVGIFSTDSMIQRIGLRELFNREAHLLFVAGGGDMPDSPKFYRWQQGLADEADDRPAPALPHCAIPAGMDASLWSALARAGVLNARCRAWLGGFFTSIGAPAVAAEARQRDIENSELRLRLVGHGETIDAEGRHPLRRFAHTPAAALASYLSTAVLPVLAPAGVSPTAVRIDFVACALAVPGECATSRHSYIGVFLRTLNDRNRTGTLMQRVSVSACSHVLMFQPGNFKKRREIVVAGLTLTPTRDQLREFGLASTVTVEWKRGAPWHRDSDAPQLCRRERVLLDAYAAAWADWEKKGGRWRKKEVPSRFVLLDNLLDTAVRLEHQDDIAIFQRFVERVSPGALSATSTTHSPEASSAARPLTTTLFPGAMRPRSKAVPIRAMVRTVSLDHGQWRAHYDMPEPCASAAWLGGDVSSGFTQRVGLRQGAVAERGSVAMARHGRLGPIPDSGSLEGCSVSLALALQKIMTSRACLARLSKRRQKALRRYYMTPWKLVDEAVFRRIGLPSNGADFVARLKALASDSRPFRVGGEVLHGLVTIGAMHDAKAARRVIDLSLRQGAFARLTDPDRQAFLSGDGAVVYYGAERGHDHDGADRGASSAAAPETGHRFGWHVHAFENGQPVCQSLLDATGWETALGALGKRVTKQAADVFREIDAIRLRLVKDVTRVRSSEAVVGDMTRRSSATSDADSGREPDGVDRRDRADRLGEGDGVTAGVPGGNPHTPGDEPLAGQPRAAAHAIWGPWRDARARRTVDDDRHGCSGSPGQ